MDAPIVVKLDRLVEMGKLLEEMRTTHEHDRFWALDRRFEELKMLYKLEDEINATN
jgi:hypothetical protein